MASVQADLGQRNHFLGWNANIISHVCGQIYHNMLALHQAPVQHLCNNHVYIFDFAEAVQYRLHNQNLFDRRLCRSVVKILQHTPERFTMTL